MIAIVALTELRWSDFVFKNCHKMVVSTSILSWLLKLSYVFISLSDTLTFFGLIMRCGLGDSAW